MLSFIQKSDEVSCESDGHASEGMKVEIDLTTTEDSSVHQQRPGPSNVYCSSTSTQQMYVVHIVIIIL